MTDAELAGALYGYLCKVWLLLFTIIVVAGWLWSKRQIRQLVWWPSKGRESHG